MHEIHLNIFTLKILKSKIKGKTMGQSRQTSSIKKANRLKKDK